MRCCTRHPVSLTSWEQVAFWFACVEWHGGVTCDMLAIEGLGARARSGSTGFRRRFRRRFRRGFGKLWCRARSGSTGFWRRFRRRFRRRFQEALVQSKSGSTGFWRRGRLGCGAKSGSTGFRTCQGVHHRAQCTSSHQLQGQGLCRSVFACKRDPGSDWRCRRRGRADEEEATTTPRAKRLGYWLGLLQIWGRDGDPQRQRLQAAFEGFNRVPEKVPEKVPGSLGAKPSQVQQVPEKVPEKAWEALVKFNRVPEKVREKVWEALVWYRARSGSTGLRRRFRRRCGRLWCRARLGPAGFLRRFRRRFWEALVQSHVRFNRPEKVRSVHHFKTWASILSSDPQEWGLG